jgi:hypothetical protein
MPTDIPGTSIRPPAKAIQARNNPKCPYCQRTYHAVKLKKQADDRTYEYCPFCGNNLREWAESPRKQVKIDEDITIPDEELWGIGIFENRLKPLSLTKDGQYRFIDSTTWLHNIVYTAAAEALAVQTAIEELEYLLNQGTTKEATLQDFFERNPVLLLDYEYKKAHPHIELIRDEGTLIPDFMLEPVSQEALCDILDLKLPSAKVYITPKNRERYSAAIFEACAQLREYSAYFEQGRNRDLLYQTYGLKAYKPKMIVIIGRRCNIDPILARRIGGDTPQLVLQTYDDIIDRAKAKLGRR